MTASAMLVLMLALHAPAAEPDSLTEKARELFRIEREAGQAAPTPEGADKAAGGPQQTIGPAELLQGESLRNDAWLHDVCFVDAACGWAVGDRGAVWHTDDGGRNWQLQDSGTSCSLRTVWFVNPQHGWAAGGFAHPYTHTSSGVVLLTRDGGRHWYHDPKLLLPALRQLRFFDQRQGWAVGNSSAMYPAGVFTSHDGGRSWMPLCGGQAAGWTSGDFLDPRSGLLAGRNGAMATVRRGNLEPASAGAAGLEAFRQLRLDGPRAAWLVGDGGRVLLSGDQGGHWQTPPMLPRELAVWFDFAALAVRGEKCWTAGTPGSRIIHSSDAGRTWSAFATPTPLPLAALSFPDDQHGWAVGAMGTILASEDGGRSWRCQRAGGARAALLGMLGDETDVPLELLARLSGNEGYLGVVEVLGRRDLEVPPCDEAHSADRVHEAVVAVGGCGAESASQFPLRQPGLQLSAKQIIDGWDQFHGGRGLDDLEAHLVRQVRVWRPEVIVTRAADARDGDAADGLIAQAVCNAVHKAADAKEFPGQITQAGLGPWRVKKVYASLASGSRGSLELTTAQLAPRLGRALADVAAPAHGLLDDRFHAVPAMLGFRAISDPLLPGGGQGDFFAGIALLPGSEARRQLSDAPPEGMELLRRASQRRRFAEIMLDRAERDPQAAARLLAETADLTRGLDAASAAAIIYRLADGYAHSGQGDLAAEAYQSLVEQYPGEQLCRPALIWLLQYYASGEQAERMHDAPAPGGGAKPLGRPDRAAALAALIERTRPDLFAQPAVCFAAAAAYRKQGSAEQAQRIYSMQSRSAACEAWRACARGEIWLAEKKGPSPKPTCTCVTAPAKPRLDGRLDDAVWQRAKPIALQSGLHDDSAWPATVMLAHDAEFLYIGIRCRQAVGAAYEAAPGPRVRDADMAGHDRVEVLIDLDRDYATYYRLTIDHRGWTADSCCGDSTWDPVWYVAARTADGFWTAEAAIPLGQLTSHLPAAGTVWAVGVQRTAPGVGFQSWTAPAATRIAPEGFGYLIFE